MNRQSRLTTKRVKPTELLAIFHAHPRLTPHTGNSMTVFFLYDERSFTTNWEEWLLPSLVEVGFSVRLFINVIVVKNP